MKKSDLLAGSNTYHYTHQHFRVNGWKFAQHKQGAIVSKLLLERGIEMVELGDFQAEQIIRFDPPITRSVLVGLVRKVVDEFDDEKFVYEEPSDRGVLARFGKEGATLYNDVEVVPQLLERSAMIGSAIVRSVDWKNDFRDIDDIDSELIRAKAVTTFANDMVRHAV